MEEMMTAKAREAKKKESVEEARVIAVIYGFFFVFLSGLLGASFSIAQLDQPIRFWAFLLTVVMSTSASLLGLELGWIMRDIGASTFARLSLALL